MARPTTIKTGQILEAARRLFLEKGFGASTADIAREAGVSEGSIFKRFKTKADLFRAAMGLPEIHIEDEVATLSGTGDVRENLRKLMRIILDFHRKLLPRVVMMWAQPGLNPIEMLRNNADNAPPRVALRALAGYLKSEMDGGRLGKKDPEVVASMIMSAVHSYVFLENIGLREGSDDATRRYIESVVDVLLDGVSP